VLPPTEFLALIERISVVDGSTGWVASFGSQLIYLGSVPLDTQAELYADGPDVVLAGALFPVQPATPPSAASSSTAAGSSAVAARPPTSSASVSPATPANRAAPCCVRRRPRSSKTGTSSACRAPTALGRPADYRLRVRLPIQAHGTRGSGPVPGSATRAGGQAPMEARISL
jgi:hypothetical protein